MPPPGRKPLFDDGVLTGVTPALDGQNCALYILSLTP